ncbi:hypothetical protein [Ohtaekwangia koreensis]|jgi:hypothetical protein|uniref:Uncharacterized protein n=1 Tax=Ohtaekwangia koreensis TaxID=688867 RepID=A0A1T5MCM8_9BACT|nr:hypothetical protein [Ohtaekwangia koreensis]SKC85915.1 hypothetical protein SAMN05660236_4993 [Ohtaekwangia koreensis]
MKNTIKLAFGVLCVIALASCEPKKTTNEAQETAPAADTTEVAQPDTTQVETPADTAAAAH